MQQPPRPSIVKFDSIDD
jgi:hypothetical protein